MDAVKGGGRRFRMDSNERLEMAEGEVETPKVRHLDDFRSLYQSTLFSPDTLRPIIHLFKFDRFSCDVASGLSNLITTSGPQAIYFCGIYKYYLNSL